MPHLQEQCSYCGQMIVCGEQDYVILVDKRGSFHHLHAGNCQKQAETDGDRSFLEETLAA
ncbi:hypothetical protein KC865_00695 [Candidatus Kaiserbacteria bacterium]|nr:hypothetical protein [Candidatus Kaiserbacteria bacterium]USN92080.1 MAG: hypothetical protein H6782_04360 [Candidatus Nomurabacteria bacterium]